MHGRSLQLITLGAEIVLLRLKKSDPSATKRALFRSLSSLGGVYIKFLQLLAVGSSFMRGWAGPKERAVFEQVAFEQINILALLEHELGPQGISAFQSVSSQPFAAGSFAQVYRATLQDGTTVAIKVLRPSVSRQLKSDLRKLHVVVKLLALIRPIPGINIGAFYKEFSQTTIQETDYINEAEYIRWFSDFYKDNETIVIPRVYSGLSTKHILVQDYIDGISLASLLSLSNDPVKIRHIVQSKLGSSIEEQLFGFGAAYVRSGLTAEFLLGDPHPGNIILLPNNKVGVIDFGIVSETPPNKHVFINLLSEYKSLFDGTFDAGTFMLAAIQFFDESLANAIGTVQSYGSSKDSIFSAIRQSSNSSFEKSIVSSETATPLQSKQIIRIFASLINGGNRFGLKLNTHTLSGIKSARTYIELLRQFLPNGQEEAFMLKLLGEQISYVRAHPHLLPLEPLPSNLEYDVALETIIDWLSHIADNDPQLYTQINNTIRTPQYA